MSGDMERGNPTRSGIPLSPTNSDVICYSSTENSSSTGCDGEELMAAVDE